jgi:hypothetical protein
MHCPRCGQQQVTEQTKFCSRCGFSLVVVADVIAHGGSLPQLDMLNLPQKKKWLTRRNGMVFSLMWLLFFLLIMAPFWGIVNVDELAGVSAILGIFGGLLLFLFSVFFLEPENKPQYYYPYPPQPHQMPQYPQQMSGQGYQQSALPPQQSVPVSNYTPPPHVAGSWRDTNDLGRGSVTEDTTRLLTKEEENH